MEWRKGEIYWVCFGYGIYIYIYIIYGLDYVRSKEKNWKRKEVKKSIGIENEILV
jgi:hypothetical protein